MHERTRKALCRLAFVLLCALPTLGTLGVILARKTTWYARWQIVALESELQDCFGLQFEIDRLRVLAPGALQLEGVLIRDPETGAEVARVRVVQWAAGGERVAVRLAQPELQNARLEHAWRLVHDRFLCRPGLTETPVRIAADDLTVHSQAGGMTLFGLDAYVDPHPEAVAVAAQFRLAGHDEAAPAEISVTRDRSRAVPETVWRLRSGGAPLPCTALAEYLPVLGRLGSRAAFSGQMSWRMRDGHWWADLAGMELDGIEMSRLMEPLPHKLTGVGRLHLGRCRIESGKIVDAAGSLEITGGYVGALLIDAAAEQFGVRLEAAPQAGAGRYVQFDALGLGFDLEGEEIRIAGTCHLLPGGGDLDSGVVLASGGRAVARLDRPNPLPAMTLARVLAPAHAESLPISRQTNQLLHLLPLPSRSPAGGESRPAARVTSVRER